MIISDETKELALISSGKAKPVLGDRQSQHFAVREERLYSHFPRKQKWCILLHPVVHGDVHGQRAVLNAVKKVSTGIFMKQFLVQRVLYGSLSKPSFLR